MSKPLRPPASTHALHCAIPECKQKRVALFSLPLCLRPHSESKVPVLKRVVVLGTLCCQPTPPSHTAQPSPFRKGQKHACFALLCFWVPFYLFRSQDRRAPREPAATRSRPHDPLVAETRLSRLRCVVNPPLPRFTSEPKELWGVRWGEVQRSPKMPAFLFMPRCLRLCNSD